MGEQVFYMLRNLFSQYFTSDFLPQHTSPKKPAPSFCHKTEILIMTFWALPDGGHNLELLATKNTNCNFVGLRYIVPE